MTLITRLITNATRLRRQSRKRVAVFVQCGTWSVEL